MSYEQEIFLEMLSAERGAAINTLEAYRRDLNDLAAFLKAPPASAQSEDLNHYMHHLGKSGMQPSSRARRRSALRQFYRFLQSESLRTDNPAEILCVAKPAQKIPDCPTITEIERLFITAQQRLKSKSSSKIFNAERLLCILEILYASGLRVSELLTLPLHLKIAEDGMFDVIGKGNKQRLVALSPRACARLTHYRAILKSAQSNPKWLFPTRPKPDAQPLTRQRLGQILKELALEANLDPNRISPHRLRHAFASHLLENGIDLISLQKLLGHADISTTQIYTHISETRKRALLKQAHPLAQE